MDLKSSLRKLTLFFCIFFVACAQFKKGPAIEEGSPVTGAIGNVVNMDQGWTEDTQQAFYFTSQGSRIMPYAWYLALEQADSQTLFRDNEHLNALRYLPSSPTSWNPDGLSVGFVKDVDSRTKQEWVGLTCAACHTTQIEYQDTTMRIDGGPSMGDFESLNIGLVAALNATQASSEKFARFANAVLGAGHSPNEAVELRELLIQQTLALAERNNMNHPDENQPHYGFARLDAIGAIFNKVLATVAGLPNNSHISNAPASYPFLWGTHQSNVVQWTGFAPNGPASLGALVRNGGEVVGVYGQVEIPENKLIKHYKSSLAIRNLGLLESWVAELKSPMWSENYLGPIHAERAAKGAKHYVEFCLSCHQLIERQDQGKPYIAVLTPQSDVGTDPQEIKNMLVTRPSGKFSGRKEFVIAGEKIPAQTTGLNPLVNTVTGSLLQHPFQTIKAGVIEFEGGKTAQTSNDGIQNDTTVELPDALEQGIFNVNALYRKPTSSSAGTEFAPQNPAVYKARPLTGIWATAPYLHNGSVPNLYELLLPANERSKKFYVGSRTFDPENVGFVSTAAESGPNAFELDTSLIGNSNSGHEYGTGTLDEKQRKELLEYLKTL